jgi:hypothetical protein
MSWKRLEEGLANAVQVSENKGPADVTAFMQMMFECSDRHISKAFMKDANTLVLVLGLRSEILSPFPRFTQDYKGNFIPCDIIGLVPGIAALVDQKNKSIAASAIERKEVTRIVLAIEGPELSTVAKNTLRFMEKWDSWIRVLLSILERDLSRKIDWREFLAGESGFVTMDWYEPLDYELRTTALERVLITSRVLLQSVLTPGQMEDPLVQELLTWIGSLRPQAEVVSAHSEVMEGEVT